MTDNDDEVIEFNFWPSFSDLMLCVVLVLCLIISLVTVVMTFGTVNLKRVARNQESLVTSLAQRYGRDAKDQGNGLFGISTTQSDVYDIQIQNFLHVQKITFAENVLFKEGASVFKNNDKAPPVLDALRDLIKDNIDQIDEIQIQGHADTTGDVDFNTKLGANRAIRVFNFLREKISPAQHLMSATTFSYFKPVQRAAYDGEYNLDKINQDNDTPEKKDMNRRIELVLFYKR